MKLFFQANFRCPFTGRVDADSLEAGLVQIGQAQMSHLKVAHITSQPLTQDVGGMSDAARDKVRLSRDEPNVTSCLDMLILPLSCNGHPLPPPFSIALQGLRFALSSTSSTCISQRIV